MSEIRGRDDGDLRKYRTEIPNVVFILGLDPYALALYGHLKRTTGAAEGGLCWKSTRTLAEETGMSVGKVSSARNQLEEQRPELGGKSLITVYRPEDRGKTATVVCNDVWPENFEHFSGDHEQRVHDMNTARSSDERKKEPLEEGTKNATRSSGQRSRKNQRQLLLDEIYGALRRHGIRLDGGEYKVNLGRIKNMLDNDEPTIEELEALPDACVTYFRFHRKLDVAKALRDLRVDKMREAEPPRRASRNGTEGTPQQVIDFVFEKANPRGSLKASERRIRSAMRSFDFTSGADPPFPVQKQLGGTDNERWATADAIESLIGKARKEGII